MTEQNRAEDQEVPFEKEEEVIHLDDNEKQ